MTNFSEVLSSHTQSDIKSRHVLCSVS